MKILVLSGVNIDEVHGGAVHTCEVAKAFVQLGHQVTLISPGISEISGVKRIICSMQWGSKSTTWRAFHLRKELELQKFDLIYERQLLTGGLGAYLGKCWKVPVVYEINSPHRQELLFRYPWLKLFSFLLRSIEKKIFSNVTAVVTTHGCLVPRHFKGKAFVGPWAASLEEEGQIEFPFITNTDKIILVSGSFHPWHGGDWLLPIAKALGKGPWKMVLSGHLERSRVIYEKIKDEIPFPIHCTGELKRAQLFALMKRSSVLLAPFTKPLKDYPFYYSPFKILEALSCALPVVTNDFDNLKELMDFPWCGQTIDSLDPEIWAQALKRILREKRPAEKLGKDYQMRHAWIDHVSKILPADSIS